ncbi:MAG: TonB family protein [Betaproteobacteria bacterium]
MLRRSATLRSPLPAPPAPRKTATAIRTPAPAARTAKAPQSAAARHAKGLPSFRFPDLTADPGARRLVVYAVGASLLIHAVLLAIRFSPFDLKKWQNREPALEVALVNAKSKSKPTKADILAQANLDGGGNTDANRQAKTPLPAVQKAGMAAEVASATQRIEALEIEAKELMTRINGTPTPQAVPKPVEVPEPAVQPSATDLMQRTLEAMRIEARVAKDIEVYQQRPKRRFVGARADEYRFARYIEDWRSKIERIGNLNYPEAARQMKLYGSLLITVSIRSDGSVENVEINRTSGQKVLDAAAVKIVEMSAPFAPFPSDIKRDTDVLHITRTWMFTKGDELRSE